MVLGHRPIGGILPPSSDPSIALGEKPTASPSDSSERGAVHFIQDIFRQATDPTMVIPMLLASPLYQAGRLGLLRSFLARPAESWLGRSLTLNVLPALGGFASETLGFSLSSRALAHYLQGPVAWDPESLINDTAMAGLSLGFLKATGFAGRRLLQGALGLKEFQAALWSQADHRALFLGAQVSGYLGLVGSHLLQGRLFPEFHQESGNIWVDALGTHLALGLGAYGGRSLLGSRFHVMEQDLARQAHQLKHEIPSLFTAPGMGKQALASAYPETLGPNSFDTNLVFAKGNPRNPKGRGTNSSIDQISQGKQKTSVPSSAHSLRDYQKEMLAGLNRDLQKADLPWLGIASPMQTGKSHLIPHIIPMAEKIFGKDTEFVILSSARIITKQIMEDLLGTMGDGEVGRLDGLVKDPKRITVASIYTLYKKEQLKRFAPDGRKRVVLMDEAYFTQAPIVQRILQHFGLAKGIQEGIRTRIVPKFNPNARLIGLSGTGDGLGHYHLSGHLNLLDAVEDGWVRNMVGERVFPKIDVEKRRNAYERMIWWKGNRENAQYLAKIYREKIQGRFERNLVYVPTIAHGRLLVDQLKMNGERVHFVHSQMDPGVIEEALGTWEADGGALVSVRMLSHGFRGKSVGAVFHTYQSTSPELFSQRTGRAWAGDGELYVLEATWDRERFSNLARILGLVEYPRIRLKVGPGLKERIRKIKDRKGLERQLKEKIKMGVVKPYFKGIPLLEEWRVRFDAVLQKNGFLKLEKETGIEPAVLSGYAVGALPLGLREVLDLSRYLGGEQKALQLWVGSWEKVVEEIRSGERIWKDSVLLALEDWAPMKMEISVKAQRLEEILAKTSMRNRSQIDRQKIRSALLNVIAQVKKAGGKISLPKAADRVYEIYIEGLPEEQRPTRKAFASIISWRSEDPWILNTITESPEIQRVNQVVDPEKLKQAFLALIDQLKESGEVVSLRRAADLGYEIYVRDLSPEEHPSFLTFRNKLTGAYRDPEVVKILENSGVVQRQRTIPWDQERKLRAFSRAIVQIKEIGQKISATQLVKKAFEIYVQDIPEDQRPSLGSLQQMVTGNYKDPEICQLILDAHVLKSDKPVLYDPDKRPSKGEDFDYQKDYLYRALALDSFKRALERLKKSGEPANLRTVTDLAYQIYVEDLPEDQRPAPNTFRRLVRQKKSDSPIIKLLKNGGVLNGPKPQSAKKSKLVKKPAPSPVKDDAPEKKKRVMTRLDPQRTLGAFEDLINQLEQTGKQVNYHEAGGLAYGIYIQGLPIDQRPSETTFYNLSFGKKLKTRILALLDHSKWVKKVSQVSRDPAKLVSAFSQAVKEFEAKGKLINYQAVADRAHQIYAQNLPLSQRPSVHSFRNAVQGKNVNLELIKILEASKAARKQLSVRMDPDKMFGAYAQAIEEMRGLGERASYQQVSDRAYAIYIQDLPEKDWPRPKSFKGKVGGQSADPALLKLLAESGIAVKQIHVISDRDRVIQSFRLAVQKFQKEGRGVSLKEISRQAHGIYCQGLSETERPSQKIFRNLVVGKRADPDIMQIIRDAEVAKKFPQYWRDPENRAQPVEGTTTPKLRVTAIDPERKLWAFGEVIARLKESGKRTGPVNIARMAHGFYIEGLPEEQRPSLGTFQGWLSGENKNLQLLEMLNSAGVLAGRNPATIDPERKRWAFEEAVARFRDAGEQATPTEIANRAHQFYVEGLPKAKWPRIGTFRGWLSGVQKDPEILEILDNSGIVQKKAQVSVKLPQRQWAFEQAIAQLKDSDQRVTARSVADLAYELYIKDLPGDQRPSRSSFRSWVKGPVGVPEIRELLESLNLIETRVQIDPQRKRRAFEQVIAGLKTRSEIVNLRRLADLARAVYIEGLPEKQRPNRRSFRSSVSGSGKDPEIWELVESSGVMRRKVSSSIDFQRRHWAFEQVIANLKASGLRVSPPKAAEMAQEIYMDGLPEEQWPHPGNFKNWLTSKKDAEIWELLESSGVIERQKQSSTDPLRKLKAFEEVIARLLAKGERASRLRIANEAHQIYHQNLPEGQGPTLLTFRNWVTNGAYKDQAILDLLESSGVIEERTQVDPVRRRRAFKQVITRLKKFGETTTPTQAADLAHEIYNETLSQDQRASQASFRNSVTGAGKNTEIWDLLASSGVIEARSQAPVDPKRKAQAFEKAIAQLKAKGELVTPQTAVKLALKIYNRGLPDDQKPSEGTFKSWVSGTRGNPEILELFESSGIIEKQSQTKIEPQRKRRAFEQAIARLKRLGEGVSRTRVAALAHELYIQGLPKEKWPSEGTFRNYIIGSQKDPEILKLVESSGVLKT